VSRARDVVEVIARTLAARPEEVRVSQIEHRGKTIIELFMAPGELGRVIGRQGRTATAIRVLANTAAEIDGARVSVEFVDD
jgi:predicted RNA-binding protein YlqC (UPF0109 family)